MVLQEQLMFTLLVIIRLKCTFKFYAVPTLVGTVFSLLIMSGQMVVSLILIMVN